MDKKKEHNRAILDQFTKQAIPFKEKAEHSEGSLLDLLIDVTGVASIDTVLDVACGPGIVSCAFAGIAKHVTGIDITPAMIDQARKLQRQKNLANLTWLIGDVCHLPCKDSSFSKVITRFSFHHFIDPSEVFGEMVRVCAPGGTVMVCDVALPPEKLGKYNEMEKLRDPSHTSALSPEQFIGMAELRGLRNLTTRTYPLEMELEAQLKASFPNPGDDERIRRLLRADLGQDAIGVGAHLRGDDIYFAYPVFILTGVKA